MKIPRSCGCWRGSGGPGRTGNRGVAIIVALMVLAIMAALLAVNARVLADLKAHLLFVEKKQQQKFTLHPQAPAPPLPTNAPPRQP